MSAIAAPQSDARVALLKLHEELCNQARTLMAKKNHDYSKNGPFDNFKVCEALQITSAENGILVRFGDKISRLVSISDKGAQVSDESIKDTILDVINYAVLYYGVHLEKTNHA